jgi:hypothetical protein
VALAGNRVSVVELEVELQDVYAWLTEESKSAAAVVPRYHRPYLIRADVAGLGHPGDLDVGVTR